MRRLVIRPGAIGDCILAMPAIRHVSCEYTELWIPSAVVPLCRELADVVRPLASTGIDLVGIGDLEMPAALSQKLRSFDSIVSWYGTNRPEFREAMLGTGVPCEFYAALPPQEYREHATDFLLGQVGGPEGLIPRMEVQGVTKRDAVVIHPFSGSKRKNWPIERYRELAARLPARVEWSAGPEEELAEATRFDDLYEQAQWIAGAWLYIGNDSGITHLAAATGTATLALFGPTCPGTWAPRGENVTVLRSQPLELLGVQEVLATASRLLDWR